MSVERPKRYRMYTFKHEDFGDAALIGATPDENGDWINHAEYLHDYAKLEAQTSRTYGDLVRDFPTVAETIESHEWDNKNVSEQRDWALAQITALTQRLAQRDRQIEVFNSGGFADADALAEKFLDLTAKIAEQQAQVEKLTRERERMP